MNPVEQFQYLFLEFPVFEFFRVWPARRQSFGSEIQRFIETAYYVFRLGFGALHTSSVQKGI